jgi:hypothetical protein
MLGTWTDCLAAQGTRICGPELTLTGLSLLETGVLVVVVVEVCKLQQQGC